MSEIADGERGSGQSSLFCLTVAARPCLAAARVHRGPVNGVKPRPVRPNAGIGGQLSFGPPRNAAPVP